jgi:hypothetical protein
MIPGGVTALGFSHGDMTENAQVLIPMHTALMAMTSTMPTWH